ncbi:MAG: ATP-binding cassette domain-containing protein [Alphaproteobacteria bacterium]|nr:ATP-binding cassette domain-containing protein [Alphaproteobacteria bacterium]
MLPLRLERVSYAVRGRTLVDAIGTTFQAGARTIILGPNGAGKSLLLRLCHGLLTPTDGRVVWGGPFAKEARKRQAMVFQRPVMLRRSAAANIDYALALRGFSGNDRKRRLSEALRNTGLSELAARPARVLSGGEQQRLALARAWSLEPEVLFLDEPTANLDPAASRAVERIIDAIHASGTKIIMTTHDLGQARRLADEVMFLHGGRLVERSPAEAFFEKPRTDTADAFMRGELYW